MRTRAIAVAVLVGCSSSAASDPTTSHGAGPDPASGEDRASDEAASRTPDLATLCPALADTTPRSGSGPSVAPPGAVEIDWSGLRDLVVSPPGWAIGNVMPIPRGMAGHASPELNVELTRAGDRAIANLADLIHVCRLASGDGARLRDREIAQSPGTRSAHEFHGWPGCVESRVGGGATASAWVSDRCRVTVSGADAPQVVAIADALAWDRLAQACAAR